MAVWVYEDGETALYEFAEITLGEGAKLGTMHSLKAEDTEVSDQLELEPETAVSNGDRAAYARLQVESDLSDFYGPYLEGFPISDRLGNKAILAAKSECCGQGGWELEWFGLFLTREAAIKAALEQGFLVDCWVPEGRRVEDYTDHELAAFVSC